MRYREGEKHVQDSETFFLLNNIAFMDDFRGISLWAWSVKIVEVMGVIRGIFYLDY